MRSTFINFFAYSFKGIPVFFKQYDTLSFFTHIRFILSKLIIQYSFLIFINIEVFFYFLDLIIL